MCDILKVSNAPVSSSLEYGWNCITDLVPLPQAIVFLEESLVVRDTILAIDEPVQ